MARPGRPQGRGGELVRAHATGDGRSAWRRAAEAGNCGRSMPGMRVGSDTAAGGCARQRLERYMMRDTDAMAAGLPDREPRAGCGNGGPALWAGVADKRLPCGMA